VCVCGCVWVWGGEGGEGGRVWCDESRGWTSGAPTQPRQATALSPPMQQLQHKGGWGWQRH